MKRLSFLILLLIAVQLAPAQSWPDTVRLITGFFDRYKQGNPGCQLAISLDGKLVFSKAWGLADLEREVPYTTETVTEAGSITKQVTAAAVLLLEQQGKLSLEDDVRKYVPELRDYGAVIRLQHLLHHTSGIREWSNLEAITGWPRTTKAYTNEDVLALLYRQQHLNNVPGAEYIYSNSNYLLLTLIIERVSGMRLPAFTKKYIFDPAGMTHTSWRDDLKKVVPHRGIAYIKRNGVYRINMPNESVYGPGALLTTAEDLLKWTNFFFSNHLGSPGLLGRQLALDPLPDGGGEPFYAAGLFIGKYRGYDIISHTGQTAGYVGAVETMPALKLTVAWLSNTTEFSDTLFVGIDAIDNLFIKDPPAAARVKPVTTPAIVKAEVLKQYAGWYRDIRNDYMAKVTISGDTLRKDGQPFVAIGAGVFMDSDSSVLRFTAGGMAWTTSDKRKLVFVKESAAKLNPAYLQSFAGTWYSKETESSFQLIIKNGQLVLEQNYLHDVVLSPTCAYNFNFSINIDSDMQPVQGNIRFNGMDAKAPVSCEVSMYDARKIMFVRMEKH